MNKFIEGLLANAMGSWRTTVMGILAAIPIIIAEAQKLLDNDLATEADPAKIGLALGALGIGFFARDNNKTSEEVGAK